MANIEALQNLRRVVEAAPQDLLHMRAVIEDADCGTARCAFGWALIDPWFLVNTNIAQLVFNGRMDFEGAAALFGISEHNAGSLFGADLGKYNDPHCVTADEVISNIDELLDGRDALPYAAAQAGRRSREQ